ncbi:autotransporter outer membrane beta-barrel domain-containing protein [Pseudomonas sp. FSL R10-1350]|uniref:autotransporter outer membrane beta-barrel domain-containing protein n=1 Tax=Pseudomonas sp. FSL R10-1350 TaxID=2662197 RepID=UPI001C49C798|nr:autotransporter outer membrane beta-barrel domain-containing protein [Pseudomonas sp. FSL R10-1350]
MPQFLFPRQSILAIAISQTLLFSSVQAFAADEDQVSARDGEEVSVSDRKIETVSAGVYGMHASSGGKIKSADMAVATSGKDAYGVLVNGQGSTFQSTGELQIETSGEGATGLRVGVGAVADVEKVTVVTTGNAAAGIYAFSDGAIQLGGGSVTTTGDHSAGILGWQLSSVEAANLQIRTEGYRSLGVEGHSGAVIDLQGSSIVTEGDQSSGAGAESGASIELSQGSSIVTRGRESHGVVSIGNSSLVTLNDSSIETFGEGSAGVVTQSGGRVELNNSHVKANGAGAVGAQLNGGTLAVNGGSIQSQTAAAINISGQGNTVAIDNAYIGSVEGPAIKVEGGAQATITVSNGSTLSAGNGRGELLDVQSDSVLDLVVDGSYLHGNLTIPEGGLVNVRLQNGTRFTGQMSDVKNLQLDAGVGWDIMGDSNVESLVLNGGSIDFAKAEGFHQLSMGELSGNGSFGLKLDMDNQQVDFLNIEGQATGNHVLSIQNSGAEPESGFDPLQVVHTGGGDAQFSVLGERVDLGAYSYGLERQGDDWFLTGEDREVSPATRSVQALFNSAPTVWYGEMSTLRSRMGEVRSSGQGGAWMRSYGNQYRVAGRDGLGFEQQQSGFSLGVDAPLALTDGVLLVGLLGGYSKSDLSQSRGSSGTVDSFYVGTYGTWMNNNGYYVDGVLKLNQFQNRADVLMSDFSKAKGSYRNYGLGASLEAGRQIQLTEHLFIEPFAQVSAVAVQGKSFSLDSELKADNAATHSLLGKVGMTLEHRNQWLSPYIKVALAQEFARDNDVEVNGHRFNNDLYGTRAELGAGLALSLSSNLQLHADFDYMNGQGIEQPWGANVGVRYAFD